MMRLQQVGARHGSQWVRQGFRVFVKHPMGFAGLFATFLLVVFVLSLLPLVGLPLLLVLLPVGSLGFMVATRSALDGRFPQPRAFMEPLRTSLPQRLALIKLGLIYAVATWLILTLSNWYDGGALDALMQAQASRTSTPEDIAAKVADPRLQQGLLLRFGLLALLSVPFWHAPALVHWGAQPAGKSLFFSTVAFWRNKGAFFLYGLTWLGVFMVFSVGANLLFALLGGGQFVTLLAMPVSMIFTTVFYASLYFTFADCFAQDDAPREPPALASS